MEITKTVRSSKVFQAKVDPHQTFALEKKKVPLDNKENAEAFKNFYENLASDLVDKLPLRTDKFSKRK